MASVIKSKQGNMIIDSTGVDSILEFKENGIPKFTSQDLLNNLNDVNILKEKPLKFDKTVTVGNSGDYGSINEALEALSEYFPLYKAGGVNVEIKLLAGFVMREQVIVNGIDLGFITITGEDDETVISRESLTFKVSDLIDEDPDERYPAFSAIRGATLPKIGQLFNMDTTGEDGKEYNGLFAINNSNILVLPYCGVKNASAYGALIYIGSKMVAHYGIFTGCGKYGIRVIRSSILEARYVDVSNSYIGIRVDYASTAQIDSSIGNDCDYAGLYIKNASIVSAYSSSYKNSGVLGVYFISSHGDISLSDITDSGTYGLSSTYGSIVNATSVNVSGAGSYGARAYKNSILNISSGVSRNCGSLSIVAERGCYINANETDCQSNGDNEYYVGDTGIIDISGYTGDARTNVSTNSWSASGAINN